DHPEVSWERGTGSSLSRVRSRVEHPFHAVKDLFGPGRTRYRGLEKRCRGPGRNRNQLCVAFALADLALLAQAGRTLAPTCA
ncbi:MAG: transposase, partial [Olsenella sp.]